MLTNKLPTLASGLKIKVYDLSGKFILSPVSFIINPIVHKITHVNYIKERSLIIDTDNFQDCLKTKNIKEVIICCSSGLKNYRNLDIFEGDILSPQNEYLKKIHKDYYGDDKYIVYFREGEFVGKNNEFEIPLKDLLNFDKNFDVIGNVYEGHHL